MLIFILSLLLVVLTSIKAEFYFVLFRCIHARFFSFLKLSFLMAGLQSRPCGLGSRGLRVKYGEMRESRNEKEFTWAREYEVRELITHICLIPKVISLKLFLDMVPSSPRC